ncbi:hypothetical protein B0H15DRAFT_207481 [Mycena belliarum]|uniref:Uncharacterized protein n=1 Tax=Mycena belliarum TaxID=1033014 RepID=A0AAD6XW39_9AGAR|nr:hypothetical protein B0H15DRAFT_207481 [Mycena belliae]
MSGQIFNVAESTKPSEFQTTAAQAQAAAPTATEARKVEANADIAKDVAENAAFVAQHKGPALTGETPVDRLQTDASIKTGAAVEAGQKDVAAAQAAAGGYVAQAKTMANNAVATAQSYIPPGSGPDGARTAGDVVAGIQTGASAAYTTTKEYLVAAGETAQPYIAKAAQNAQPHLVKAKDVAASYMPGAATTQTAPVSSQTAPVSLQPAPVSAGTTAPVAAGTKAPVVAGKTEPPTVA